MLYQSIERNKNQANERDNIPVTCTFTIKHFNGFADHVPGSQHQAPNSG